LVAQLYGIYANLIYAHRIGLQAEIFTGNGIIRIVDKELKLENKPGTIVSIYALQETARGITLEGFKYPLTNAVLSITQCLGLSNVVENVPATIKVKEGILLVFIENS
jgi:thiamine pyrophosphokinase